MSVALFASTVWAEPPDVPPQPATAERAQSSGSGHACSGIGEADSDLDEATLETARSHHQRALNHAATGDYQAALTEWRAAYELSKRPLLLLNQAGAYDELGRQDDAVAALRCFVERAGSSLTEACSSSIRVWTAEIEAGLSPSPEQASVLSEIPAFSCTAPALHAVSTPVAIAPASSGSEPSARTVEKPVIDGSAPNPNGATERTLAVALAAVGVTALVAGAAFGVESMRLRNRADELCTRGPSGDRCSAGGVALGEEAITAGNWSTAFFAAGAAALTGGVVLWLVAPRSRRADAIGVAPFATAEEFGVRAKARW